MARKRTTRSDSESDFIQSDSDASYVEVERKHNPKPGPAKRRKRVNNPPRSLDTYDEDNLDSSDAKTASPHARSAHILSKPKPLQHALLGWYEGVSTARGMPWRKPFEPTWDAEQRAQRAYEVWVSEIMLQQTQVATVIPYYNKWMSAFPTIRDLAASDIETVNGLWKGLGYYSRAARLLSGAKTAVESFDGRLPDNAKEMEARIPGIGRYSAGAICSIAYNECAPVLDGNVHRLLSRVLAVHAPPKSKSTLDVLWAGAAAMVENAESPGDVNQALIELGSTVCKVSNPTCEACPLKTWCRAYQLQQGPSGSGPRFDGAIDIEPDTLASQQEANSSTAPEEEAQLPDMEDICTLCLPLPASAPPVTTFPLRATKKKAREELDIVHVVEWRAHAAGDRWFLLVRRPPAGLLAGLYEFPTTPNVAGAPTSAALRDAPRALLAGLLADALSAKADGAGLRVERITPAGDVVHVFSHIRKTYRVQWVLLHGGGPACPALAAAANASAAVWTRLDAVADANIGTGVMKVWAQARALWEDEKDEEGAEGSKPRAQRGAKRRCR